MPERDPKDICKAMIQCMGMPVPGLVPSLLLPEIALRLPPFTHREQAASWAPAVRMMDRLRSVVLAIVA